MTGAPVSGRQALLVTEALALPSSGGGGMDTQCHLIALKQLGYHVALAYWREDEAVRTAEPRFKAALAGVALIDLSKRAPPSGLRSGAGEPAGVRVRVLRRLGLDLEAWFGGRRYAAALREVVSELRPEFVMVHTFPALAALSKIPRVPVLFEMEPFPSHLQALSLRYRTLPSRRGLRKLLAVLKCFLMRPILRRQEVALAARSTHIVAMDPGQGAWLGRKLGRPVSTYQAPILDGLTTRQFDRPRKKKVILVGHLRGLLSLCSLEYLAEHLADRLWRELEEPFELHIIGDYELPEWLGRLRSYEHIRFRGRIHDIEPEFRTADVVLSTSTLDFGSSTRVRAALAFGAVLVAHRNSSRGVPELRHEENALLCDTPDDFIRNLRRSFTDRELCERLRRNARKTYEESFSLEAHQRQLARLIDITLDRFRTSQVAPTTHAFPQLSRSAQPHPIS